MKVGTIIGIFIGCLIIVLSNKRRGDTIDAPLYKLPWRKKAAIISIWIITLVLIGSDFYEGIETIRKTAFFELCAVVTCVCSFGIAWPMSSKFAIAGIIDNKINELHVFYKGKKITIDYRLDDEGKFWWSDSTNPQRCLWYTDGTKINRFFTAYRIMNYMHGYLAERNLISYELQKRKDK